MNTPDTDKQLIETLREECRQKDQIIRELRSGGCVLPPREGKTLGQIAYESYFTRGELAFNRWDKYKDVSQGFENAAQAVRAAVLADLPGDYILLRSDAIHESGDEQYVALDEWAEIDEEFVGKPVGDLGSFCRRRLRPAASVVEDAGFEKWKELNPQWFNPDKSSIWPSLTPFSSEAFEELRGTLIEAAQAAFLAGQNSTKPTPTKKD